MKHFLSQLLFVFLFLVALFFPFNVKAEVLDDAFDWARLRGSKLGYYVGSFDPIHLGHQKAIDQALKSGEVDYVLIYPAPGSDGFKNRSDLALRQKLIASLYQIHPKVLISSWTPKDLQTNFASFAADVEVIGIIGSDVVTEILMGPDKECSAKYRSMFMRGIPLKEKHCQDAVGALMALKANSFLVVLRSDVDLSHLENSIYDRSIRAFIQSENSSSTEVRHGIQNSLPFEKYLSFSVQAMIKQEGLYGFPSRFNKALQAELLEMQECDQKVRFNVINNKASSEDIWKVSQEIDAQNGQKLKEIIDQYGWPGVSLTGLEGACAAWLLAQHQDQNPDFQKSCLEFLKIAVDHYEASAESLAYLTDRVNKNEGRPQVYGTQWVQEDGKFCLYATEDVENLDERRFQMGLSTIAEYKKQTQLVYQLSDEDFK